MADPLSITASLLAVTTAAIQSTKALIETVKRYKGRNKTLQRLQNALTDLTNILESLTSVINAEKQMAKLLQGPINRCSQVCREFEQSMEVFNKKSNAGIRDWAKMEFMRGDMNDFIETIEEYKSTISIGLGTINMLNSKVSQKVLQDYVEMVKDTAYNLQLRLQQIDEKLERLHPEHTDTPSESIDLEDEREVTEQCLRVCQDAKSYIESLSTRESSLLPESSQSATVETSFEAQLRTRRALDESRDGFIETISILQRRLGLLLRNGSSGDDDERSRLLTDLNIAKQGLDICNAASEASRQKIYRVGEVIADGDSDQVVVTTLADLFDVKIAHSKNNSAQLVGSMSGEELRHLTEHRYSSRFAAAVNTSNPAAGNTANSPAVAGAQTSQSASTARAAPSPEPRRRPSKPTPNEMRKRDEKTFDE